MSNETRTSWKSGVLPAELQRWSYNWSQYVCWSERRSQAFSERSMTTDAWPLSAGMATIEASFCSSFRALDSAEVILTGCGRAVLRIPTILVHTWSASGHSICLRPPSTAATNCGRGIFWGAGVRSWGLSTEQISQALAAVWKRGWPPNYLGVFAWWWVFHDRDIPGSIVHRDTQEVCRSSRILTALVLKFARARWDAVARLTSYLMLNTSVG